MGNAMLKTIAIVLLSALTTLSDLHGQDRLKDLEEEYFRWEAEHTMPPPEYPQGVQVDAHEGDSLALVALFNATGGPSTWLNRSGWLQAPVSEWHGISLDSSGRVTVIKLNQNVLTGVLPKELGDLSSLVHLDLNTFLNDSVGNFNRITGAIPVELGQLSSLTYLDLEGNLLTGTIPPKLKTLAALQYLNLSANLLEGEIPSEISELKNLEHLYLGANNLVGTIPPELGELGRLQRLSLWSNELTGEIPEEFSMLSDLERLTLNHNDLTGPIPPELGQLVSLESLSLRGNQLAGPIPPELGNLSSLEVLSLEINRITGTIPRELATLQKLRVLDLDSNDLSGEIPSELAQLRDLKWLILRENNLTGPIPTELGQLAKLEWLLLYENNLTGTIPSGLGQLSELTNLSLSNNRLSGTIPAQLKQLTNLDYFSVRGNELSGPVPDLTGLDQLEYVYIQENRFLFADLLPNAALSPLNRFTYAPQDSIETRQTCTTSECVFTTPATAQGNRYQWYRNGDAMPNEQSQTLRVNAAENPARYHATITNNLLPDLTLVSRKKCIRNEAACQPSPFAHEGDSLALVAFYNATGGASTWLNRSGWLQAPVSEWHGISVDSLGRVTFIKLNENGLTGVLPQELGQLNSLANLNLQDNLVTGAIPPELKTLAALKHLNFGFNQLEGEIPTEIGDLTNLEYLHLGSNDLVGSIPTELGELAKLQELHLFWNELSGEIPLELTTLSKIRRLDLNDNNLTGPIPPELGQLVSLEYVDFRKNQLIGTIPPELGNLHNLEALTLAVNRLVGTIPRELGQLEKLRVLNLGFNELTGEIPVELAQLGELETLVLRETKLTGPIPRELAQLTKLDWLLLYNNNLTGTIPSDLGELSELTRLNLHGNALLGTIPTQLNQLTKLEFLSVWGNKLSGPVPDLAGLDQLESVYIQENRFLFADLLPSTTLSRLDGFTYAPQDTIETQLTCSASGFALTTPAKADGNRYQWYRNDESIPGAQSDTLRLAAGSDPDHYHATITNDALPDLTLISYKVSTGGADPCTTQQYANVADSTLLVDFYNRTHGSLLWHNHTGWLEEPVAEWYGITLDASGRVTHVNLSRNNLVGQLPLSQLHQLPNLRYLDVSGNEFSGTIPKGLGALTQLEYLDLSHNTLAGEIPKELAGQAPLKMLDVGDNQLVGAIPIELSQITTLQKLSVFYNQLSGPTPDFTGLDQLDSLDVSWNAFLFMDLLPNALLTRLDNFVYAPQDSIETLLSRTASGFALTTTAKAAGNRYQWYRDDQPISGPQSDTLQVSATSDPAQYHVAITNDRLPDLTLVSRKKGVHDGLTLTEADIPDDFLLHQSYPNPFAEATTVAFELGTPEHVRIVVYDLLGKVVATIADGRFTAGMHRVEFTGDHLASGQYMYRMEAGAYRATRFMSVVR